MSDESINPLQKMSDIMELNDINDFMADEEVEKGLLKLTSILANPDANVSHIARHIVQCQALSTLYALKGKYYMTIGKGKPDSQQKKNFYLTMREEFRLLADSLKYLVKSQI